MHFIFPKVLFLLVLVPIYIYFYFYFEKRKSKDIIPFGNTELLAEALSEGKKLDFLKYLPLIIKVLILIALIFTLARPKTIIYTPIKDSKVMLLLDISISMEATDIPPDRITAAKQAAIEFVNKVPKDLQVGLALFSGSVKVLANPSINKTNIVNLLKRLNQKKLEPGTAIGDGILACIDSLTSEDSSKKGNGDRIIILITDGEANVGTDPIFAATQAKMNSIVIQTLGIGNPFGTIIRGGILTRLDEVTLKEVASITKGNYFNAQNIEEMKSIYEKIKSTIKLIPQESEITFIPASIVFALLLMLQILKWTKFRFS